MHKMWGEYLLCRVDSPWVKEGSPRGSRLGRLRQVLKADGDQEPEADPTEQLACGLNIPNSRHHLADGAVAEWLGNSNWHDLLVRAVAVGDLCLRLADAELGIVRVQGAHDDLKAGSDSTCKDHIRLIGV